LKSAIAEALREKIDDSFNQKQIIIPQAIMPIIVTESEFQKFRGELVVQPIQAFSRQRHGLVGCTVS